MKILTRKDLDAILKEGCTMPGCKHEHEPMSELFLTQVCHPKEGVYACYNADGFLKITCKICEQEIANVKVGK